MKRISEHEAFGKYKHFLLEEGDFVVSSSGTLGRIAEVHLEDLPVMLNTSTIRFRPLDESKLDRLYLRYFLESQLFQQQVKQLATGSVQLNYGPSHLAFVEMPLPPIKVQKVIGEVLENFTKAMQQNYQIARNLEELAQTVFRSWFIDFDPIASRMVGEKPFSMDAETYRLFPDSFVESEVGMIPLGWNLLNIGSLGQVLLGGTPSRKREEFWGGNLAWINSGKVNDFRISTPSEQITELGAESSSTKLLPKGTTVIAITGATLGQFSRLEIDSFANQSVIGILPNDISSDEYIYLTIKNNIERLVALQTGGAQQHINRDDVTEFKCVYPGPLLVQKFTEIVKPMFAQIGQLTHQSQTLEAIRDALLPRLISGELQIPDEMLES